MPDLSIFSLLGPLIVRGASRNTNLLTGFSVLAGAGLPGWLASPVQPRPISLNTPQPCRARFSRLASAIS
ncbi:hypothetical protein [Bosea sp. (in: a-proteobacteria)]|uniref:hypothetical protein n=1 Tax=Bosea sp. (in: a-proteobacteria) TaxID=1871050 RepID=UPI002FC8CA26